ncbi:hypothetical protein [Massilia sp. NP310]|uniref:hypothetical protein n=1 Tax=Massilia sp. NP310 TaxID=2861282 RepID=UPI001C626994|nr:hypothetical protein [Massilia sp. NP310]QYG04016.1 hypothetical protein KY496_11860 [Massilia sp. NP310]
MSTQQQFLDSLSKEEREMIGMVDSGEGFDDGGETEDENGEDDAPPAKPAKKAPAAANVDDENEDQDDEDDEGEADAEPKSKAAEADEEDEGEPAPKEAKRKGGNRIPEWRVREITEERNRERREKAEAQARADALAAELDALKKASAKSAEPEFDFEAAEEQVALLLSENNPREAAKLQKQIRVEAEKSAEAKAVARMERMMAEREAAREAAAEEARFKAVVRDSLKQYPELDADSEDANREAIDEVDKYARRFNKAGSPASEALSEAVELVMSMSKFSKVKPSKTSEDDAKPSKKAGAPVSQAHIKRAVDAASKQPPNTTEVGLGNRAAPATKDVANLSVSDMRKMSKDQLNDLLANL